MGTDTGAFASEPGSQASPQAPAGLGPSGFDPSRVIFEARPDQHQPWIWRVWDVEHEEGGWNHFPVVLVDGKGACDDLHEAYARICAAALNAAYAPRDSDGSPQGGDGLPGSVHDGAGPQDIAQ